jgi:hypothetical protein
MRTKTEIELPPITRILGSNWMSALAPILSKNDFRPEDFRRITTQQGILIQELGLSDSEILHFLQTSGMLTTFSTVSLQ